MSRVLTTAAQALLDDIAVLHKAVTEHTENDLLQDVLKLNPDVDAHAVEQLVNNDGNIRAHMRAAVEMRFKAAIQVLATCGGRFTYDPTTTMPEEFLVSQE